MDVALPIERNFLRPMTTGADEAKRLEQRAQRFFVVAIDGELDKRHTIEARWFWRIEQRDTVQCRCGSRSGIGGRVSFETLTRLRFQIKQRLHRIDRRAAIGRFTEYVVENLERQWPRVAGDQHVLQKTRQIELALTRKA